MFGSNILEIAIGVIFVYVILSLICSSVTELITTRIFALRSKNLKEGIQNLLHDPTFKDIAQQIYAHPLITSLVRDTGNAKASTNANWISRLIWNNKDNDNPSYIPSNTFTLALLDIVRQAADSTVHPANLGELKDMVNSIQNDKVKQQLSILVSATENGLKSAENGMSAVRKNIETWFDSAMEQTTAWYKQRVQGITLIIAFLVCLSSNADTIMLANGFANDPSLRAAVVASASEIVANGTSSQTAQNEPATTGEALSTVESAAQPSAEATAEATPNPVEVGDGAQVTIQSIPPDKVELLKEQFKTFDLIGWTLNSTDRRGFPNSITGWISKIIGVLITTFAVSLGAPFWFDVLNKLVNLRAAGEKPKKTTETTEEEKQEYKLNISVDNANKDQPGDDTAH